MLADPLRGAGGGVRPGPPRLRVLALHSFRTSGDIFRQQVRATPHSLTYQPCSASTCMRRLLLLNKGVVGRSDWP